MFSNSLRLSTLFFSILILITSCHSEISPDYKESQLDSSAIVEIKVNPEIKYQAIDNFGVSGAWWAQEVGNWQEDNRQKVIDLLFNISKGIGLSAYRYNIGAGGGAEISDPWRNTDGFEVSPGVYDWNRDAEAIRILKMVKMAGVSQFVAFANSPPSRLTRSGMVSGSIDGGSNLGLYQEPAYAIYLMDIVEHLRKDENIPIGWISPVNEPLSGWNPSNNREGCSYSSSEMTTLLNEIREEINDRNLSIQILAPESSRWGESQVFLDNFYELSIDNPMVDVFSIHSYHSTSQEKELFTQSLRQTYPQLPIWMTEWSDKEVDRDTGIKSAITLASTIHDDLTLAGVSAWHYWIAVSKYYDHTGLLYANPGSQIVIETKRLWALGNYSRFIRPGSRLILAQVNTGKISVSAFKSVDDTQVIIVVINTQPEPQTAQLSVLGSWLKLKAFETSQEHSLDLVYASILPSEITFPGLSITTLLVQH